MAGLQLEYTVCLASGVCHDVSISETFEKQRQPQANRKQNKSVKAKVFTLHPGLRDAQIPPGNRRQLTDTQESKAERVKGFKKKICLSLLVPLLFPRDREFIFLRTQEFILR